MRRIALVVTLFLVGLLYCSVSLAEQSGDAEPQARLYLIAEGSQSAIPERYLRYLCEMIQEDEAVRSHYKSVSVYRYSPDLASITGRVIASLENRAGPDAKALVELSELMNRREHRCWGEPAGTTEITYDRVELLRLEWIGGSMAGDLRAQRAIVHPPPRPPEQRAGHAGKKAPSPVVEVVPPAVDPPEYIPTTKDPRKLARALGLRFLPIKSELVLKAQIEVSVPASSRCRADGRNDRCVLVGEPVRLALKPQSNTWIKADDVQHTWKVTCRPAPRGSAGADTVHIDAVHDRSTTARVLSIGVCSFGVLMRVGERQVSVVYEHDFAFRAGPVLVRTGPYFIVMSASSAQTTLRERRYIPFVRSETNHQSATEDIFEGLYILPASDVVEFGRQVRQDLMSLGARADVPEYRAEAARVLTAALASSGDTLGHRLLVSEGREVLEISTGDGTLYIPYESMCRRLSGMMGDVWSHEQINDVSSTWEPQCQALITRHREALARKGTLISKLLVRRGLDERNRVYRAVQPMQQAEVALVDVKDGIFMSQLPAGYRNTEKYLIHGIDVAGAQTRPWELRVHVARSTPSLGIAVQVPFATAVQGNGVGAGFGGGAFTFLLDEMVRVDASFHSLLSKSSFNVSSSNDGESGAFPVRAQLAASLNLACVTFRLLRKTGSTCDLVAGVGGGHEFVVFYPYGQVRLGYNIGGSRFATPELIVDIPFVTEADGVVFRASMSVGVF